MANKTGADRLGGDVARERYQPRALRLVRRGGAELDERAKTRWHSPRSDPTQPRRKPAHSWNNPRSSMRASVRGGLPQGSSPADCVNRPDNMKAATSCGTLLSLAAGAIHKRRRRFVNAVGSGACRRHGRSRRARSSGKDANSRVLGHDLRLRS